MILIRIALAFTIVLVGQDWVLSLHDEANHADLSSITDKVEYAARDYRMAVYKAFRTDRAEFDSRRTTGEKLASEWKANGNDSQRGETLVAWFQQATTAAEKHQASPEFPSNNGERISQSPSTEAPANPITPAPVVQQPRVTPAQPSITILQPQSIVPQPNASTTQPNLVPVNPFDSLKNNGSETPAHPIHANAPEIVMPRNEPQILKPAKPRSVTVVPFGAMPESEVPPKSVTVVPFGAMPESEVHLTTPDLNNQQSAQPKNVTVTPFGAMPEEAPKFTPQISVDSSQPNRIKVNPLPAQKFEPRDVQIFNNPLATTPAPALPKTKGKPADEAALKAILEQNRTKNPADQSIGANLDESELDKKMELLQSLSKKLKLNDEQKEKLTDELKPADDGTGGLDTQLNLTELSAQIKAYQDNYHSLQAELAKPEIFTTDQTESVAETLKTLESSHKQMDLYKAIAPTEVKGALSSLGDPKSTWSMLKGQVEAQRKKLNEDLNMTNAQRQQQLRRLDAVQEIIDGRAK